MQDGLWRLEHDLEEAKLRHVEEDLHSVTRSILKDQKSYPYHIQALLSQD